MELSSFVGRMSALKNELLYVLHQATVAKTYLSNMDQIFMILTLIKLGTKFDNIREQILTGITIPTIDDIFARILCHSSTATRSRHSEVSMDASMMLAPFHPRGDSLSICGGHHGKGQRPYCTYCNRPGPFKTSVISYMAIRLALLMWPSLLNRLHLQLKFNLRLHLRE